MAVVVFPVDGGGQLYVEIADGPESDGSGLARAGARERIEHTWGQSLSSLRSAAEGALNQLQEITPTPDEIEVAFGVKMNGRLGTAVISAGGEANLMVKVVWKKSSAITD